MPKWEKVKWAIKLSELLSGRAMDLYTRMSNEDAKDYDKLKKALLTRYILLKMAAAGDSGMASHSMFKCLCS